MYHSNNARMNSKIQIGLTESSLVNIKSQTIYEGCIKYLLTCDPQRVFYNEIKQNFMLCESKEVMLQQIQQKINQIDDQYGYERQQQKYYGINVVTQEQSDLVYESFKKIMAAAYVVSIDYEIQFDDNKSALTYLLIENQSFDYGKIFEDLQKLGKYCFNKKQNNEKIEQFEINKETIFEFFENVFKNSENTFAYSLNFVQINFNQINTFLNLISNLNRSLNVHQINMYSIRDSSDFKTILPVFQNLKILNLCYSKFCFYQYKLPNLEYLSLEYCDFNTNDIQEMSKLKLPKLKYFRIYQNFLSQNTIAKIGSASWKQLEAVSIESYSHKNNQKGSNAENLSNLFLFPKLKQFTLCIHILNQETKTCSQHFLSKINKENLPSLERLALERCLVSGKLLFDLNINIGWPQLKQLYLASSKLNKTDIALGIFNICQYPLPKLKLLRLCKMFLISDNMKLSKSAIKHLLKSNWANLTVLSFCKHKIILDQCEIQQQSLKTLIKCYWNNLQKIALSQPFYDFEMDTLFHMNWPNLKQIDFRVNIALQEIPRAPLDQYKYQNKSTMGKLNKLFLKNCILRRRKFGIFPKYEHRHDVEFLVQQNE